MKYKKISFVEKGSIADKAGITAGDSIAAVDGNEIADILEYKYYTAEPYYDLLLEDEFGIRRTVSIDNPDYEDLGLSFEYPILCKPKGCRNKCIFCFIDQLPKGLRQALYFKDDDVRLSFLQGNYITLSNLSQEEINSIVKMRLSPLNISVHSTNGEIRSFLMGNENAANIKEIMERFADAGISMNCQIVLCRDINDGENLTETLWELANMYPRVSSVSVVPAGLTKHREGLCGIKPFDKQSAEKVIDNVLEISGELFEKHGTKIIYLADEFYLLAEMDLPEYEYYEDFPQLENGVGMSTLFIEDFKAAMEEIPQGGQEKQVTIVTGMLFKDILQELINEFKNNYNNIIIDVIGIKNTFLGEAITVAGLVSAGDIIKILKEEKPNKELYIPSTMLRHEGDIFLDGLSPMDIEKELCVKVKIIEADGYSLASTLLE